MSTIATSTSIVAISIVSIDRRVSIAEKSLYNFYYPLQNYLEGHLIEGMNPDKKDVEQIARYRHLAKSDTMHEFEKYRNGNYKREDSTILFRLIRRTLKITKEN